MSPQPLYCPFCGSAALRVTPAHFCHCDGCTREFDLKMAVKEPPEPIEPEGGV